MSSGGLSNASACPLGRDRHDLLSVHSYAQMRRCEPGLAGIRHCLRWCMMMLGALMTMSSHLMKAFLLMSPRAILATLQQRETPDQNWSGLIQRMSRLIVC